MALGPITTARSGGDDSWMGSRHAVAEAHPGTLKASAFTSATGVTDGIVPSGYPVAQVAGLLVPFNPATTGGNTLRGFSIGDRDTSNGDETTAVLDHGRIIVANLPISFTPPAGSAFVYA